MDAAALAGLCALLAHGGSHQPEVQGVNCAAPKPAVVSAVTPPASRGVGFDAQRVAALVTGDDARDGIARVAYAEAGNQGDSGLAAVVYTILNRLEDGRWGGGVDAVLNAPHQFEPVMRAGGSWRHLPPVSESRRARIDTIINLALEGRLPDLTNGARFFQNPRIVAERAGAGEVSAGLVNFGGAAPSAVIGAHSFYVEAGRGGGRRARASALAIRHSGPLNFVPRAAGGAIFVAEIRPARDGAATINPEVDQHAAAPLATSTSASAAASTTVPDGPMFVRPDGQGSANWR